MGVIEHQKPYTNKEHWNKFWRMFYKQVKEKRIIEIDISEEMIKTAEDFSKRIIAEKLKETVHQLDSRNEWKRWMTGVLGEIALETFLEVSFRDATIGCSKDYNVPDLSPLGLQVGVKSFRVGNFPLVNRSKRTYTGERVKLDGQIFIGIAQNLKTAYLFGIAFDDQLFHNENNPHNNRFVKDVNALGRKIAFTEMDSLYTFQSLTELSELVEKYDSPSKVYASIS